MDVSVVIVNYNGYEHTRNAVLSILQYSAGSEIIVVDNCSTDGSGRVLQKEFPQTTVIIEAENRGFGFGCNRGAEAAKGKYLFFLNNDTLLSEDSPLILAAYLEKNPAVGACGPKLLNQDGTFQISFGLEPSILNEWIVKHWQHPRKTGRGAISASLEQRYAGGKIDWVTAAALMMRKDLFERLNGFDESFFMYFEDAELCKRIREMGYSVVYLNTTSVTHLRGQSAKDGTSSINREYRRSQIYYYRKHRSLAAQLILRMYLAVRPLLQKNVTETNAPHRN